MEFFAVRPFDPNWEERVEGKLPLTLHAALDSAQVIVRDGLAFVQVSTLRNLGYEGMFRANDVVKLNGKFYELEGYDKKLDVWWVSHIDVEKWLRRNVHPLRVARGPSSDDVIWYEEAGTTVYYNERTGDFMYGEGPAT